MAPEAACCQGATEAGSDASHWRQRQAQLHCPGRINAKVGQIGCQQSALAPRIEVQTKRRPIGKRRQRCFQRLVKAVKLRQLLTIGSRTQIGGHDVEGCLNCIMLVSCFGPKAAEDIACSGGQRHHRVQPVVLPGEPGPGPNAVPVSDSRWTGSALEPEPGRKNIMIDKPCAVKQAPQTSV